MGGPHEDAIYRAGLYAERTEHAFRIVDCEASYLEALAIFDPFFTDVNAVDGASFGALVAGDTGGEVEAVEATITGHDRDRLFRVFKLFGKCSTTILVGFQPVPERDPHTVGDRHHGVANVTEPIKHGILLPILSEYRHGQAAEAIHLSFRAIIGGCQTFARKGEGCCAAPRRLGRPAALHLSVTGVSTFSRPSQARALLESSGLAHSFLVLAAGSRTASRFPWERPEKQGFPVLAARLSECSI